ncbi:tryptophan synthase subunit alpha [Caldicellulosiruptoraceae bacterium PP1]
MNLIDKTFMKLKNQGNKAFIGYMTCGYPTYEQSYDIFNIMNKYCDIIEVGFPFSDPTADGEIIQEASSKALKNGITIKKTLELISKIKNEKPIILMLYANNILRHRIDNFFKMCSDFGVDACIIPDVPYEEKKVFEEVSEKYNIYIISLVSISSIDRAIKIAKDSKGFIYAVSKKGTTGFKTDIDNKIYDLLKKLKSETDTPICTGFGISDEKHIKELNKFSDGVIVGSALIKKLDEGLINFENYLSIMSKACKTLI